MSATAVPGTIAPDDEGLGFIGRLHSGRAIYHTLKGVGARGYFALDIIKALAEPRTYGPEVIKQLKAIGVDSIPLVVMVSAFIGGVISLQSRYQLFPGIQLSVVGFITRQSLILELGPLLTGLVLAGRVGAQMAAEIGTMRVTDRKSVV